MDNKRKILDALSIDEKNLPISQIGWKINEVKSDAIVNSTVTSNHYQTTNYLPTRFYKPISSILSYKDV